MTSEQQIEFQKLIKKLYVTMKEIDRVKKLNN